jgi:site-specific DNA-cytosine methylase
LRNQNTQSFTQEKEMKIIMFNSGIEQPQDKGLVLADVVEPGGFEHPCELREFNQDSICHHAANATDLNGNESIKRVYAETGKAPTLTTMGGGHREPKVLCDAWRGRYKDDGSTEQRLEIRKDRKTNSLTTVQKDNQVVKDASYRKLTPLECERLQTFPDGWTLVTDEKGKQLVSNTQRYKGLGNAWTVDVIAHIFSFIGTEK